MNNMIPILERLRTLYTRANAMKSTYDSLPGSSDNDYKALLDELDSIIKLCEVPKTQGPIDSYIDEIINVYYPHGGCPDIIRELAYAEFEAGIIYEADACHCHKLEKEIELFKTKEKEWMKTYSEMKDRLLGYEVNDIIHEIRKQTKVK